MGGDPAGIQQRRLLFGGRLGAHAAETDATLHTYIHAAQRVAADDNHARRRRRRASLPLGHLIQLDLLSQILTAASLCRLVDSTNKSGCCPAGRLPLCTHATHANTIWENDEEDDAAKHHREMIKSCSRNEIKTRSTDASLPSSSSSLEKQGGRKLLRGAGYGEPGDTLPRGSARSELLTATWEH